MAVYLACLKTVMVTAAVLVLLCVNSWGVEADGNGAESFALNEKREGISSVPRSVWEPQMRTAGVTLNTASSSYGGGGYTSGRPRGGCVIQPSACVNSKIPNNGCCGASCYDLDTNPEHCGKCYHTCETGRICCSGKCKNVNRDKHNCGGCKKKCAYGESCVFGLCGY